MAPSTHTSRTSRSPSPLSRTCSTSRSLSSTTHQSNECQFEYRCGTQLAPRPGPPPSMPPWGRPMLKLRRGIVTSAEAPSAWQQLTVEVDGTERPAQADTTLVGPCHEGDEVVVNTEAQDLQL